MKIPNQAKFSWLILKESVRSFQLNNNFQTAATLAYYGFFALIPLFLLVLILLSQYMLSSEVVAEGIASLTEQLLPQFNEVILKEIRTLAEQRIWGLFSIIILVWAVTPFASALRVSFRRVFRGEKKTHFITNKLFNIGAVLALLLLFIFVVVGKIFYSALTASASEAGSSAGYRFLNLGISAVGGILFLGIFYLVFCPVRLTWTQRLGGAATATLLLFIIRPAFGLLLKHNPNYGFAFGSLKAVFVLTVWFYYAFLAVLFGAEVMANSRRKEALLLRRLFLAPPGGKEGGSALLKEFVRTCDQGETLFEDGDEGEEMFYVLSGAVNVNKHGKTVKILKAGEYFGEMSMILGDKRTASITVAEADTRLIAISRKNFEIILRENPEIVKSILNTMALRLKQTTEKIVSGER